MKTRRAFLAALACLPGLRWLKPAWNPTTELRGATFAEWEDAGHLFDAMLPYQQKLLEALMSGQRLALDVPRRHGKAYVTRLYLEALEKTR